MNAFGFVIDQPAAAAATQQTPSAGFSRGGMNSINLLFSSMGGTTAQSAQAATAAVDSDFAANGAGSADATSHLVNMNISTSGSVPSAESNFDRLLDDLGLSMSSIQSNNGQLGADRLPRILSKLTPSSSSHHEELSAALKVQLSRALRQWQSLAYRDIRLRAFTEHAHIALHCLIHILFLPDDHQHGDYMVEGQQVPALHLAQLLQHEARETPEFSSRLFPELITTINTVLEHYSSLSGSSRTLSDAVRNTRQGDFGAATAASLREETLRALLHCFPVKVNDLQQLKFAIAVLLRLLLQARGSQLLCAEASRRLQSIGVDQEDDLSLFTALWGDRTAELLAAIKAGHTELKRILRKNKPLFAVQRSNPRLEAHIAAMVDSLGLDELAEFLQQLADFDAAQLIPALPSLLQVLLDASFVHSKFLVMGLLLAVALSGQSGCQVLLPQLGLIGSVCTVSQQLFVPFFKLLTVVSALGDEASVQCLFMVASTARSGLVQSDSDKAAVLEAVNIIKDKFSYSNIFKPDTLKVLEDFSYVNKPIFDNIARWNSGKSARKGDRKDYLINAGRVLQQQRSGGKLRATAAAIMFARSPSGGRKAKYSASSSSNSSGGSSLKVGAISPSPQSHNISYLQQQQMQQQQQQYRPDLGPGYGNSSASSGGFMHNSVVPLNSSLPTVTNSTTSDQFSIGAMTARPPPSPTISTAGTAPLTPSIIPANAATVAAAVAPSSAQSPFTLRGTTLFPATVGKNQQPQQQQWQHQQSSSGAMSFSTFAAQQHQQQATGSDGRRTDSTSNSSNNNNNSSSTELRLPDSTHDARQSRSRSPTRNRISLRSMSPFGKKSAATAPARPEQSIRSSNNNSSSGASMNKNRSMRELRLEESASQKQRDEALAQELQQLRLQVSQLEGNLK